LKEDSEKLALLAVTTSVVEEDNRAEESPLLWDDSVLILAIPSFAPFVLGNLDDGAGEGALWAVPSIFKLLNVRG